MAQGAAQVIASPVRRPLRRGGRWSLAAMGLLAVLLGCQDRSGGGVAPSVPTAANAKPSGGPATTAPLRGAEDTSAGPPLLTEISAELGITDGGELYPDGKFQTPEITPGGVALFDFDGDGRLDIYQVRHCPPGSFTQPAPNRLFRQLPSGTFEEVPGAAGLNDPGFGHGVAVGDIDNDGDLDVFVTNFGKNALYRNDGGKFVNVTEQAGFRFVDQWSSSCGFFDYDRDGYLDLFVCHFAHFDPAKKCHASNDPDDLDYCGPHVFEHELSALYHNNGDGTFSDVTTAAGITQPARSWGVVLADLTGDGWPDIYVANDEEPAQLWVNKHDGTFADEAIVRGCALNIAGKPEAGMGVAIGDVNDDGLFDLLKTHITSETHTLYVAFKNAKGRVLFKDSTAAAGFGAYRAFTGWGTGFVDFDHDGDLDAVIINGRVSKGPQRPNANKGPFWNSFAEPKLLFENNGKGKFKNISPRTGRFGSEPEVSRGVAFGDLDGDGDLDMVVCNLDNTLRIYRNDFPKEGNHWLIVRCITGKRDAYGAVVTVEAAGSRWRRAAHPTYSYLASNDPRAHFGLGPAAQVDRLEVEWPDGRRERFTVGKVDQAIVVRQGEGEAVE